MGSSVPSLHLCRLCSLQYGGEWRRVEESGSGKVGKRKIYKKIVGLLVLYAPSSPDSWVLPFHPSIFVVCVAYNMEESGGEWRRVDQEKWVKERFIKKLSDCSFCTLLHRLIHGFFRSIPPSLSSV